MMIVNRFLESASRYPDRAISLGEVFEDANISESEQIIEAIYVIADRRIGSGYPISIDEVADSIPTLISDRGILDAAIEISLRGLAASGLSAERAYKQLLESTPVAMSKTAIQSSVELDKVLKNAFDRVGKYNITLPIEFGPKGYDHQSRYELRRILGSGSQGTVYEAVDHVFQEDGVSSLVALKVFHGSIDADQSRAEGTRARRVRHTHVARVIDQGLSENGEAYLAYELIEGKPLDVWVKQRPDSVPIKQACRLVMSLARGVQSAHGAGVVHRDIKPSNILMNRDDEPVLTDFGIAHSPTTDPRLSGHYGTRGSLAFMAPEQFVGNEDGGMPSVDVYALGGILYWLLTGLFPNGDTVADALTWLEHRIEGGPDRINPWPIDPRLQAVIRRALDPSPRARYQSAEALAEELEDYLQNRPIKGVDTNPLTKTALFCKRNPLVALLQVGLVLMAMVIGWVWSHNRGERRLAEVSYQSDMEIERLNSQVAVEQERVAQIKDKARVIRFMIEGWSDAVQVRENEGETSSNLLFLHMLTTSGLLDDDPQYADKILNKRNEVAEQYLAAKSYQDVSPIHRALWHEMLANWYKDTDPRRYEMHMSTARRLAGEYAPADQIWISRLNSDPSEQ